MYSMASAMSSAVQPLDALEALARRLHALRPHLLDELGDHRARLDERDAQVAGRELLPQRLAEGADAVLGEVVDGRAAVGAAAGDRADVDEVAHLARAVLGGGQQRLDRRVGDVEDAVDVDVDHPLPVVERLVGRLVEQHHAGVVDDRVEPAQLVDGAPDRAGRLLAVGDVGLDDAARRSPPPARRAGPCGAPRSRPSRRPREAARRRLADATARAGDQRDGSVQSFSHAPHGDALPPMSGNAPASRSRLKVLRAAADNHGYEPLLPGAALPR